MNPRPLVGRVNQIQEGGKDLIKLTGLTHDELWENDFNLDDWDVGFVSDVPLTIIEHYDDDGDYDHEDEYEGPAGFPDCGAGMREGNNE